MKRTPEEQYKILQAWSRCDQSELRAEARAAIAGGRIEDSLLLSRMTRVYDSDALYRGMQVPPGDRLLSLPVGEAFELQPASWSRKSHAAKLYTQPFGSEAKIKPGFVPLFMVLTGQPIRGFDVAAYLGSIDGRAHPFQEVVVAGKFRLLARSPFENGQFLAVHQTGVYESRK